MFIVHSTVSISVFCMFSFHSALPIFASTFFFQAHAPPRALHSFPTRRSSDLTSFSLTAAFSGPKTNATGFSAPLDRKSTRLNSSHVAISYAVFCLKKKMDRTEHHTTDFHCRCHLVFRYLL